MVNKLLCFIGFHDLETFYTKKGHFSLPPCQCRRAGCFYCWNGISQPKPRPRPKFEEKIMEHSNIFLLNKVSMACFEHMQRTRNGKTGVIARNADESGILAVLIAAGVAKDRGDWVELFLGVNRDT